MSRAIHRYATLWPQDSDFSIDSQRHIVKVSVVAAWVQPRLIMRRLFINTVDSLSFFLDKLSRADSQFVYARKC